MLPPNPTPGTIIAGAGQAAGELAIRLRQAGYTDPITLVGAETHLPYQRPPLSKAFLSGQVAAADLLLRPDAAYAKADITFIGGTLVTRLDRAEHSVALSDGRVLAYDWVVLATGGRARLLSCPGAGLGGVHVLRTIDDVLALRTRLVPGARLVIVGGGYIGLEVAAVAIRHGLCVTLLEAAPRLLARVTGPEMSAFYESVHRAAGVDVHTGVSLAALLPAAADAAHVGYAQVADGRVLPADFVLAGIGLVANTSLAADAGLPVGDGILVDEYCRTPDARVLAIGDCANHPNALLGRRVRLESVPNAIEQARVAAETICGRLKPYAAVPWFWSDQYDLKLQAVGLAEGHDSTVLRGTMAERAFSLFYLREGVVIAADSVNRPGEFMLSKRLVGSALTVPPAVLADTSRPLKDAVQA